MSWNVCIGCGRRDFTTGPRVDGYECRRTDCRKELASERLRGPMEGRGAYSTTARSRRDSKVLDGLVGGSVVPGSGAVPGLDGDRVSSRTMAEEKLTDTASFTLNTTTWDKLIGEAGRAGKMSVLLLNLSGRRIAMLPLDELLERVGGGPL